MLSLGLVLAFSASAMAVDVKFSGSYYAAGLYLDKVQLKDKIGGGALASSGDNPQNAQSTAFYYQRVRVQTDFIVSPGLSLVTRFDALERIWGGARGSVSPYVQSNGMGTDADSAGTKTENQNIAFDHAYLQYVSPIGFFRIGYQPDSAWGTVFGDSELNGAPVARFTYGIPVGPVNIGFTYTKGEDNSYSYAYAGANTVGTGPVPGVGIYGNDRDYDYYSLSVDYKGNKTVQGGLVGQYRRIAQAKAVGTLGSSAISSSLTGFYPYLGQAYALNPYAKAKFGPVAIEAEATYAWGDGKWEGYRGAAAGAPPADDIKIVNISAYLNVVADFKMVYGGVTFAYVSGDDPGTTDQLEGGIAKSGKDWNPTLIMFNYDRCYWVGKGGIPGTSYGMTGYNAPVAGAGFLTGDGTTSIDNDSWNFWFWQAKVGVRPVAALDIYASASYANADKKPATNATNTGFGGQTAVSGIENNRYGWEIDLVGTYKITNNLSYMLGGGYLFTGDFFKGTTDVNTVNNNGVNNNYMLINKLTLTF